MKKMIAAVLFSLILAGCDGDLSSVKNGTLEFDNSITVGQAFDKYSYFSSTQWESFETSNGRKIVEVTGFFTDDYPILKQLKPRGIDKMSLTVQFRVNKDDTFEIAAIGMTIVNDAGEETEQDIGGNMSAAQLDLFLNELYNDRPLS